MCVRAATPYAMPLTPHESYDTPYAIDYADDCYCHITLQITDEPPYAAATPHIASRLRWLRHIRHGYATLIAAAASYAIAITTLMMCRAGYFSLIRCHC